MSALVNFLFARLAEAAYARFSAVRPSHVRLAPVWACPIVERPAD